MRCCCRRSRETARRAATPWQTGPASSAADNQPATDTWPQTAARISRALQTAKLAIVCRKLEEKWKLLLLLRRLKTILLWTTKTTAVAKMPAMRAESIVLLLHKIVHRTFLPVTCLQIINMPQDSQHGSSHLLICHTGIAWIDFKSLFLNCCFSWSM